MPHNDAPDEQPAPRTAWEAAQQLAAEGRHVHYHASGQSVCLTRQCAPTPV